MKWVDTHCHLQLIDETLDSENFHNMRVENQSLIITKNNSTCSICPEEKVEVQIKDKFLCKSCVEAIKDF